MGTSASLELANLACRRGGRLLFEGLSLSLAAGGAALVTGPNGTGKSSLLRVIAGLLEAEAGQVSAQGRMALSNEQAALDPEWPLARALRFWAQLDEGWDVMIALERLGIAHLAPVPVRMLSTGQRKRASLARVVASGAAIWLLDEPGNGLDTQALALLEEAIAAHREAGGIALVATHQAIAVSGAVEVRL